MGTGLDSPGFANHMLRERPRNALAVYRLALRLFQDRAAQLIAGINIGATHLKMGNLDEAVRILEETKAPLGREFRFFSASVREEK